MWNPIVCLQQQPNFNWSTFEPNLLVIFCYIVSVVLGVGKPLRKWIVNNTLASYHALHTSTAPHGLDTTIIPTAIINRSRGGHDEWSRWVRAISNLVPVFPINMHSIFDREYFIMYWCDCLSNFDKFLNGQECTAQGNRVVCKVTWLGDENGQFQHNRAPNVQLGMMKILQKRND
jgi:hypothetical protein